MASTSTDTPRFSGQSNAVLNYFNPLVLLCNLWRNRDLIIQFTRRDIEGRYRGSFLGLLWSFFNPLIQLLIYTFIFGFVFASRWPGARTDNLGEFAVTLFCGITVFNIFSECVGRAPGLVLAVPNYVKKVVFPLEILPVSALGTALFHGLISLGILLIGNLLTAWYVPWTLILLPVVLLPLIFLSLGLGWFLSSVGVFIRDLSYTIALVLQVLLFTSPIFFPIERIPQPFQQLIRLNPLASLVENVRRVVLWGQQPSWSGWLLWTILTAVLMFLGYAWFMQTKKAFADVL